MAGTPLNMISCDLCKFMRHRGQIWAHSEGRLGNRSSDRWSGLPTVTQLVCGKGRSGTQASWLLMDSSPLSNILLYIPHWRAISSFSLKDFICLFVYLLMFRQREKEGDRERNINVWSSCVPPTGNLSCNQACTLDWELNRQPFGLQAGWRSIHWATPAMVGEQFL